MEVILLERISKLGQMGETVKVRDGFARNYLLPLGKALRANAANKTRFEAERATLEARNLERKSEAQTVADVLDGKSFIVVRSAGETGQLYGSVAARDVVEILAAEGFNIGRNQVHLNTPIKSIGLHKVELQLHAGRIRHRLRRGRISRRQSDGYGLLQREAHQPGQLRRLWHAADGSVKSHFLLSVFRVDADRDAVAEAADDAAALGWYTVEEIRQLPVPQSVLECAERLAGGE